MHSKIIILIVFIVLISCNRDQPEGHVYIIERDRDTDLREVVKYRIDWR